VVLCERIQMSDRNISAKEPTEVERRTGGRGDRHAVQLAHLVVGDPIAPYDDAAWLVVVRPDDFDGCRVVSIHFAPCRAAAALPVITPRRRDHSHAACAFV
jgi:hypothetical protein